MGMTYTFKTTPDPHQVEALKQALAHRRFGIFFQQRVGKTKVAVDFCGCTMLKNFHRKVLIVCPLFVRTEWMTQIQEHLPLPYSAYLYPKNLDKRHDLLLNTEDGNDLTFIIVNYDVLANDLGYFLKWDADTIIFDESHLIGHYNSRRSKAAARLGMYARNVLLLTGTPIPKRWYHIFGQFRAMDSRVFGSSYPKFIAKWAIKGGYMGKEITGCTDYESLSKIISKHSIRVLRKDVFDEPEVETLVIPVTLNATAKKTYDTLKKQYVAELSGSQTITADLAITRIMRLQQLCGGFITTDDGLTESISTDKLDVLRELVETKLEGGEQVVVFYRFTAEGNAIYGAVQHLTSKVIGRIDGSVPEAARKSYRDFFQSGDSEIILIQIATGAMGISLDRAHINIFYSLDFSLSNFLQAKDRVMGRNQHDDVTNYLLAVEGTVDTKIMKTLKNDEDVASKISDSWRWMMED